MGGRWKQLESVAALVAREVEAGRLPGAVVAVGSGRGLRWHCVAGAGMGLETLFPVASITKPVVALGVMQLVERGLLLLDRPVAEQWPAFGVAGKEAITPWHLLTHTSGMQEPEEQLGALFEARAPRDAYTAVAAACGLDFPPGSGYAYRSLTFAALAELITRLGGMPYPEWLREKLFEPLGMGSTGFAPTDPARAAPVEGFGSDDNVAYFNSLATPHAGLWSCASDLMALGRALLGGGRLGGARIVAPATLATMTRLQTEGIMDRGITPPRPATYALGWDKPNRWAGTLAHPDSFGHGGATGSLFWVDPAWDLVFVCLASHWDAGTGMAQRALNAVYGALRPGDHGVGI